MRRSGHHAVGNWIIGQLNAASVYINSVKFHPLYRTWSFNQAIYFNNRLEVEKEKKQYQIFGKVKGDYILTGIEDEGLQTVENFPINLTHEKPKQTYKIIVLRDAFNLWASRIKRKDIFALKDTKRNHYREDLYGSQAVDVWTGHANEFLKDSDYICVNFNQWFSDVEYRKELSKKLGLVFSDEGKNVVSPIGGGSSFDKINFNHNAEEMEVLNRYKYYLPSLAYQHFFHKHKEMKELSQKIFFNIKPIHLNI